MTVINQRTVNWTILPCPTPAWAKLVHPDLEPDAALERLWEQVEHVCRLDEPDPAAAWHERLATLEAAAARLDKRRFDALHLKGPGTDLRVGLLPGSRWLAARLETIEGIVHVPNLPTEEVFSAPDPERVDGVVRATKPLVIDGTVVRGLRVRFEGGRAVEIDADEGAGVVQAVCSRDAGAARLGEIALVDREGRIGALDTVFFDTLLDENQASHLAFGNAYDATVDEPDRGRSNRSAIHIDFMIGSPEITVTGITSAGDSVPVMADGAWALGSSSADRP
jgi:aminopeptidase